MRFLDNVVKGDNIIEDNYIQLLKPLNPQKWLCAKPRGFPCRKLYRSKMQTKVEDTPQTLGYKVFFFDKSIQKVMFFYCFVEAFHIGSPSRCIVGCLCFNTLKNSCD
jgi:hypothetical protein